MLELGPYNIVDPKRESEIEDYLLKLKSDGDSVGGRVSLEFEIVPQV